MKLNRLNKISLAMIVFMLCLLALCLPVASVQAEQPIYYGAPNAAPNRVTAQALMSNNLTYTSKQVLIDNEISVMLPQYYDKAVIFPNGCPAVAGTILIGYYDLYKENLIPNFTSFIKRGSNVIFKPIGNEIQAVMSDLFDKMNVNKVQLGATKDDFKLGLKDYVQSKGYNIAYNSYLNSTNIDYNAIASSLNNGNPIAVFTGACNIISELNIGDNSLKMTTNYNNSNHIFIASGIKRINFYNGNSLLRTDTYLKVSTGLENPFSGYILLENIRIDDIIGVVID